MRPHRPTLKILLLRCGRVGRIFCGTNCEMRASRRKQSYVGLESCHRKEYKPSKRFCPGPNKRGRRPHLPDLHIIPLLVLRLDALWAVRRRGVAKVHQLSTIQVAGIFRARRYRFSRQLGVVVRIRRAVYQTVSIAKVHALFLSLLARSGNRMFMSFQKTKTILNRMRLLFVDHALRRTLA